MEKIGEECCGEVLKRSVGGECCREVLEKCVGEDCCREVLVIAAHTKIADKRAVISL